MVDKINAEEPVHILTIEDPVEYVHRHKRALVNQREIHADTHSFKKALRSALRQDPDVVLVGEMRDLETIESALTIAETGHLTFGTLHTNSTVQTINRIIDVFPSHQQAQIRAQLSLVLEGVICQSLIPKAGGKGRALALEIMIPNSAIRNLIREDKIHQIYGTMQSGQTKYGMQTFNQSLSDLVLRKGRSPRSRPSSTPRTPTSCGNSSTAAWASALPAAAEPRPSPPLPAIPRWAGGTPTSSTPEPLFLATH